MSRIKINLPDQFDFSVELFVRITDINYGGHVGNDKILTLIHEARMHYLQHFGYTELNVEGVALIMGDAAIEFKKELFYNDKLVIFIKAHDFTRSGFDIYYKLIKNGIQTVALAKTGMICYDYQNKKITALPANAFSNIRSMNE